MTEPAVRPGHVRRLADRPVAGTVPVPGYGAMFNAGVLHHEGAYHLFVRAVRSGYRRNPGPGDRFLDYISDIVVFTSADGLGYAFQYVLARGGESTPPVSKTPASSGWPAATASSW